MPSPSSTVSTRQSPTWRIARRCIGPLAAEVSLGRLGWLGVWGGWWFFDLLFIRIYILLLHNIQKSEIFLKNMLTLKKSTGFVVGVLDCVIVKYWKHLCFYAQSGKIGLNVIVGWADGKPR